MWPRLKRNYMSCCDVKKVKWISRSEKIITLNMRIRHFRAKKGHQYHVTFHFAEHRIPHRLSSCNSELCNYNPDPFRRTPTRLYTPEHRCESETVWTSWIIKLLTLCNVVITQNRTFIWLQINLLRLKMKMKKAVIELAYYKRNNKTTLKSAIGVNSNICQYGN